ncbi:MAG: hypothetical protein WCX28_05565 [Bacteriovoracaceae bacterium]
MDALMLFASMMFVICAVANGQETTIQKNFSATGITITYRLKLYAPPYVFKKNDAMLNQASVLHCSHLFYSKLAEGNIAEAAAVSDNPEKVKAKFTRFTERVGKDEFLKLFGGYFSGTAEARAELTIGNHTMLVIYDSGNKMFMGQMYAKEKSQYVVAEREHKDLDQLGRLLSALQDGALTLK